MNFESVKNSVLCILCLTFYVALSLPRTEAAEPIRLRVLSYNIHHAEGVDQKLDLQRIARVILSVKPDVVALQEVDIQVKRTGSVDQSSELARLTNMHVVFGANIELQGGHYGNAVLSRFPIIHHKNHLLPNFNSGEQRGVVVAGIKITNQTAPLLLLATHLDHRRDDRGRIASAKIINKLINQQPQQPALLAADLNDVRGSKTLRELETMWKHTADKHLATFPVSEPQRQIDFILCRPDKCWKVLEVSALDEAIASDHRAVFAQLEFLPDDKP